MLMFFPSRKCVRCGTRCGCICQQPLSSATSLPAVSIKIYVFMAVIGGKPNFSASDWHHWLRMPLYRPAQVAGDQIDHHARQHQNHTEPDAPIPMCASPIRTRNDSVHKLCYRLLGFISFIDCPFSRFHPQFLRSAFLLAGMLHFQFRISGKSWPCLSM